MRKTAKTWQQTQLARIHNAHSPNKLGSSLQRDEHLQHDLFQQTARQQQILTTKWRISLTSSSAATQKEQPNDNTITTNNHEESHDKPQKRSTTPKKRIRTIKNEKRRITTAHIVGNLSGFKKKKKHDLDQNQTQNPYKAHEKQKMVLRMYSQNSGRICSRQRRRSTNTNTRTSAINTKTQ